MGREIGYQWGPDREELQRLEDQATVYCRKAGHHIAKRDWFEATKALVAALREADIALQSLTPGGSEYVGDPKRCAEYAKRIRNSLQERLLDSLKGP